jgi:UDP-3-O-[3-hydroxymyristoyl] glucosamine N-acyltransferase
MNSVTSQQIIDSGFQALTLQTGAQLNITLTEALPPDWAKPSALVFATTLAQFEKALSRKAQAFILKDSLWSEVKTHNSAAELQIWSTPNIQMAMSQVLPLFDLKSQFLKPGVHPTAAIHPLAKIDASAHVGAHCTVEAHAIVGAHTILYPSVYIGAYCEVGPRCIVGPSTSIGGDGFGFVTDRQFKHHKIPQIGRVVIEEDCEFGSQCAIDRAALTETRIKRGSKFDNFCHIAHNVEIGENALAAGGLMVAGSTKIGRNFMAAGSVLSTGHLEIADNVVIAGRSAITSDIREAGVYGGYPLEPQKESLKTIASLPHLKTIRKQLNRVLKHLNLEKE